MKKYSEEKDEEGTLLLKKDLDKNDFSRMKTFSIATTPKQVNKSNLGIDMFSVMKMEYAMFAALITDALNFINEYGYDPLINEVADKNKCVVGYCRYVTRNPNAIRISYVESCSFVG